MSAQLDEEFRDFMHGRWPAMVRLAYASGGAPVQVRAVTVGPQKFFSFALPDGSKAVRWKAYDSSGNVVASGTSRLPGS